MGALEIESQCQQLFDMGFYGNFVLATITIDEYTEDIIIASTRLEDGIFPLLRTSSRLCILCLRLGRFPD